MKSMGIANQEKRTMIELKSCPFCGELPKLYRNDVHEYRVECLNMRCACLPRTWFFDTEEEVIEAWNRRVDE